MSSNKFWLFHLKHNAWTLILLSVKGLFYVNLEFCSTAWNLLLWLIIHCILFRPYQLMLCIISRNWYFWDNTTIIYWLDFNKIACIWKWKIWHLAGVLPLVNIGTWYIFVILSIGYFICDWHIITTWMKIVITITTVDFSMKIHVTLL